MNDQKRFNFHQAIHGNFVLLACAQARICSLTVLHKNGTVQMHGDSNDSVMLKVYECNTKIIQLISLNSR